MKLKDESNRSVAKTRQAIATHGEHIHLPEKDAAVIGTIEGSQDVQQG